eukprot:106016_1
MYSPLLIHPNDETCVNQTQNTTQWITSDCNTTAYAISTHILLILQRVNWVLFIYVCFGFNAYSHRIEKAKHSKNYIAQNDSSHVGNVPCGPDTKCKKRRRSDDNKHKYKICPLWTPPQW